MNRRLFSISAFVVCWLASAHLAEAQERRFFDDWLADCRVDGYCSATAYDNPNPPSGAVADYILRVGRHPTATYWEISLSTVADMPGASPEFAFVIDDADGVSFSTPYGTGAYGAVNDFFMLGDVAASLLDKLVQGQNLEVDFANMFDEPMSARFSLTGLAASLLWIDDQQHRIGSERVAYEAPAGLTPVSPDYPAQIPQALLAQHFASGQCESFELLPHAHEVIQDQLDDNTWMWLIPCAAGAYNFIYRGYTGEWNGDYFRTEIWADYSGDLGWAGTDYLVNPDYDRDTRILTTFNKGRGIGDCGTIGTWQWHDYGFRLLEFRAKDDCDAAGGPESFPMVWQWLAGEPRP
ncbi:MAG: DUF1176 domain-containing protein [Hyphomicrobiaceae bacterium]|nr:DUF1176 domain-containing protein [Hyphomicrobiaceae bacterium]MCC0023269.1 DUF1176 domain-containing protein [Hyphomicrobiaceae bacterium]